jgi:RNA-directed DNA polymerase
MFRPYIQGWINYYSHFYKSELTPTLQRIDAFLLSWARNKFKRLRQRPKGARDWLARVVRATPYLFAQFGSMRTPGRGNDRLRRLPFLIGLRARLRYPSDRRGAR